MDKIIMNSGDSSKLLIFLLQVLSLITSKRVIRIEKWKTQFEDSHCVSREKEKV